jgi:hypothetical protein
MPAPPPPRSPPIPPRRLWQRLSLAQLQRLRHWRELQRARRTHRLECAVWEAVLTGWMLGWTGWLPVLALRLEPLLPLCLLAILLPQLYVYARCRAHAQGRLRCDWLEVLD